MLLVDWNVRQSMGYTSYGRETVSRLYTECISFGEVLSNDLGGHRMGLQVAISVYRVRTRRQGHQFRDISTSGTRTCHLSTV